MKKSLITLAILFTGLSASSQAHAYALIDLDPKAPLPNLTIEARGASIDTETKGEVEAVEVSRKQRGHLLALVPVNFMVRVVARANGRLEIDYPWYSFMTLSHREELETKLKAAADNAKRGAAVGSVRAEGESENPKFTAEEAEAVTERLILVLAEYDETGE